MPPQCSLRVLTNDLANVNILQCYYLMSFDQNMIIDATTGSIARFVNHSCNPNCRMIKWIVSGQPRMALFAGDKPIMTGDELTYDYNFDPFSAKNVQKCLCGEANCRGVLGPKPREAKPAIKTLLNNTVKAGKRKISELLGNGQGDDDQPKAKKAKPITSTKGALASVGMKVSKGAATALKKGMSTLSAGAKKVALTSTAKQRATTTTSAVLKKKTTTRVIKAYGKESSKKLTTKAATAARGKGTKALKTIPQAKAKASTKKEDQKAMAKKTSIKKTVTKKVSATITSEKGRVLSTAAGVTKKTSPKKKQVASWVAINASPRKALDLERGSEITVAE
jgi:[histone H3]-lysine4 N-trimethyltransferase ASH1L